MSRDGRAGLEFCSFDEYRDIFWEQFKVTNERCPDIGIPYDLSNTSSATNTPRAPSCDQIVPKGGYVRGNMRWVSGFFNRLKQDLPLDEVADMLLESYMFRRGVIEEGEVPQPTVPIYYPSSNQGSI